MNKNNQNEKGFSLIELIIVVVVIGIISAIAVPNLLKARRASNEASAVSSVSMILRSELTYKMSEGFGEFTDLSTLHNRHYIDATLGTGANIKSGYRFEVDVFPSNPPIMSRVNIRGRPTTHSLANSVIGTGNVDFGVNERASLYQTEDNTPVSFDDNTRLPTGTAVPVDRN